MDMLWPTHRRYAISMHASSMAGRIVPILNAVRESANKSAASTASPGYVKFQAVIKSAASAASLCGGRASGRLDHGLFLQVLGALAPKKLVKNEGKIAFLGFPYRDWLVYWAGHVAAV